ncbi:hypothetical protein [Paenibacillus thiaminolyticus]|uniref:Uncharacterized protein n=1 Tax=Paenibacillus thiaminolyticus TaxID=49283 RepID=A0A3A3GSI2_PANTH|nr:hypothetical protein [Paenibacillus thiaminolyticus]RJG26699.1 hypothetical protein DQX05_01310 [Paenibacillus thiaminolyticus]
MHEVIFTVDELRAKCAEWQKVLRLQDWIVGVEICREREMHEQNRNAEIDAVLPKRMASIRILDPVDYPPDSAEPQDMELSLVHELLHIHLFPLFADREEEMRLVAEEQAIEAISRGLIALARRGGEQENAERTDLRGDGGADSTAV